MSGEKCGHTAQGAIGGMFVCDKPKGHKGWHEQTDELLDGIVQHTNWGSDGLGIHASKDRPYGDGHVKRDA